MKAPLPVNETERLRALHDYGVLDTPPELAFDDLTHLAAQICQTPTALVTLIDEHRQWFKSLRGFTTTETKRDLAFCAHSILQRDVMVVPDATKDPRFADNALVTGAPHIRFYAGAPLLTAAGFALGSLAVIDYVPRQLSAEQIEELKALGRQAVAQLELRRQLRAQQKQAHAALLVSERRYRRLVESNIIGVMIANTDGRITEANDMFLQTVGYTRDELQAGGVRWDTMTPPEWRGVDEHILMQLQTAGVCAPVEKEYLHRNGRRVPILASVALIDGAPGDCICVIEDLTARKLADEKRRASDARYRALFEYAPDGIVVANPESYYLDANASTCRMLGYTRDELIGLHASDIVIPAEIKHIGPALNAIKAKSDYSREWQFRRKDGSTFPAEVMVTSMPDGNLLGLIRDISSRKQAEKERLQVFERITDAFVALDKNWCYTYLNANAGQLFGRRPEDLVGKHIWTEFPEGVGQKFHLAYEKALKDQQPAFLEEYYPPYDQWFENRIYPSPEGLTIYFHDVTERKKSEALLTGQKQVLELIATGAPLPETLTALVRIIEAQSPEMLCTVLLLDADGVHVRHGAAPSLPVEFARAIDGQPIGPRAGSCGTAAFRREPVVVEDIATDPLWADYRAFALPHGLRACWSTPIFNAQGQVLGTFAIYYRQPGRPTTQHQRLIEIATQTAAVAIGRKQAELELRSAEQQLHALVVRMNTVREEEAKRIARELHDDLGQQLTALNMELSSLALKLPDSVVPQGKSQFARMQAGVDRTIESVQKIAGELRLGQLDLLGLPAAIEWQLQEFQQRSGLRCKVSHMEEISDLTDAQATAIFRIVQETLTNIARHAKATEVELSLRMKADRLMLEVRDNGRGITTAELRDRKAIGLLGMRERAEALGGGIVIAGEPDRGTTIQVTIPHSITEASAQ